MSAHTLITPLTPFTPQPEAAARPASALQALFAWLSAQRQPDLRVELGEREWLDVGAGKRDLGIGCELAETAEERAERRRAIAAWYGDLHKGHRLAA